MPRPFTTTTWNPNDLGPTAVLSNNNLTVTGDSDDRGSRSRFGASSGKWYFEVTCSSVDCMVGVSFIPVIGGMGTFGIWPGTEAYEVTYFAGDGKWYEGGVGHTYGAGISPGGTIGVYIDLDDWKIGFITSAGDHGFTLGAFAHLNPYAAPFHAIAGGSTIGTPPAMTANFGGSTFVFGPPSGFQAGFGGPVDQLHSLLDTPAYAEPSMTGGLRTGVGFSALMNTTAGTYLAGGLSSAADLPRAYLYATPSLTGDLQFTSSDKELAAAPAAVASITAALSLEVPLTAALQSIAAMTADLDVAASADMAATMAATSSLSATLAVDKTLSASLEATATMSGAIPSGVALAAAPQAVASITASLLVPVQLAANFEAVASITAPLAYRLRNFFEVTSGATVAVGLGITYNYRMTSALEVSYSINERLKLGLEVASNIGRVDTRVQSQLDISFNTNSVRYSFEAVYHLSRLQYGLEVVHSLGSRVKNSFDITFNTNAVRLGLEVSYSNRVQASLEVVSSLGSRVASALDISYAMSRVALELGISSLLSSKVSYPLSVSSALYGRISSEFGVSYDITGFNRVLSQLSFGYSLMSTGDLVTVDAPVMYINGKTVQLETAEVSFDEGGQVWEGTFTLLDPADALGISIDDAFDIVLGGDAYAFVVDSRAVSRSGPAQAVITLYGRSPLVAYSAPRAELISKTWEADTAASDIAEELIPGIAWNIVDWVVPAGVFGVQEATPYVALSQLAEAAGGLIESLPNGLVVARYLHPVTVPDYGPLVADLFLSDSEDNFSYSERYQAVDVVDLITITNASSTESKDRAEFTISEDPEVGTLYVYPNVWRDTAGAYATGPIQLIEYTGVESRQETERVEFVAGKASVRFPVVSIDSVVWGTFNLGSVTAGEYTSGLSCSAGATGYSLAKVTYTTKAHTFRITGVLGTEVQLVIEE